MKNKCVEGRDSLSVKIYRKKSGAGSLLFKSRSVVQRVHVLNANLVKSALQAWTVELHEVKVLQMSGPRQRNWVLEYGACPVHQAKLFLWELKAGGDVLRRFKWTGSVEELRMGTLNAFK